MMAAKSIEADNAIIELAAVNLARVAHVSEDSPL